MQRDESCEDQEREVRKILALKGIDACNFEVVNDRAASGTKNDRDVFNRLRSRIDRGEINIVAVDDQSRFSRADEAFCFIKDLVYFGGRFISTGEGVDTAEDGWELRVKVMELHNSTTILELGRRVRRGQLGRVLDDGSAGDYPFGYESFFVDSNWVEASRRGPKPKKGVRILEAEARWVRDVFAWFADDEKSIGWITRELTRLGVRKGHKATTSGWHHQQVRRMLANSKYIGVWQWGATKTVRGSQGKTKQAPVPPDQRVVQERPGLRIIDQGTWERAQRRLIDLNGVYGQRPGQKRRGPRVHHSRLYPHSLLGGLLYCHSCGARLWAQHGGGKTYFGCPNHRKGSCSVACRVSGAKAEQAISGFVTELLTSWPEWLREVAEATRRHLKDFVAQVPDTLRNDEQRRTEVEKQIENLVNVLAEGSTESPALRRRLDLLEQEHEQLRRRVEDGRRVTSASVDFPDDCWIQRELADLSSLLRDDPVRAARPLRRLLRKVTAQAVVAPGKKRGYLRLHLSVSPMDLLKEVLKEKLPDGLSPNLEEGAMQDPIVFQLNLGSPTRSDNLAPQIAELRGQDVTWLEIGLLTGVGSGNAYNIWKRWIDALPANRQDTD
jgi:hypothetical protein